MKTLDDSITDYLNFCLVEKGLAKNTIQLYRQSLALFAGFVGNLPIREVTPDHVSGWARSLSKLSASTMKVRLTPVRCLAAWLVSEGVIKDDFARLVDPPKVGKRLPVIITMEQALAMIDAAKNLRDRALIALAYGCGLRVSELVEVELGDVMIGARLIRIVGKGQVERRLPLSKRVISVLEQYIAQERPRHLKRSHGKKPSALFPGRYGSISRQCAYVVLRDLAAELGFVCTPHTLRRAAATHMNKRGANLIAIKEWLGHSSVTTTERYIAVDSDHLSDTIDRLHPRGRS